MKKLKIITVVLGVFILLLAVVGVVFSSIYEDKVKGYIIEQINNSVDTKIDVASINFSVFRKFPYASLEFKKVTAEEITKNSKKETLFSVQSIYLQFNVFDILNENYVIKKINVEEGLINAKIDKYGNDNYHFWKTPEDSSHNSLSLELEKLRFRNITFYVLNEYKNIDMAIEAKDVKLSGNFSKSDFTLNTQAKLFVQQINDEGIALMKQKKVNINTALHVNQTTNLYQIKKGEIAVEDLKFSLNGSIKNKEKGINLDILSEGENLEIEELFSLLPEHQRSFLSTYQSIGNITYSSTIKGDFSVKRSPSFNMDFTINNGKIVEKKSDRALTNLNLRGSFNNGENNSTRSSKLTLDQLDADFGSGHISGTYSLSNFKDPYIAIDAEAELAIETVKDFFKIDTLEVATGNLNLNLKYKGYIKELNDIKANELQKLAAKGTITINDAQLKIENTPQLFKNINGHFLFNNNNIKIDSLKAQTNDSKFSFKGNLTNLLAYLFVENEKLTVNTKLHANKLVLDDLLLDNNADPDDSVYVLQLPKNVDLKFDAKIDTFLFRKFNATQLHGNIKLRNQLLSVDQIAFNSMEGNVNGKLVIDDSRKSETLITGKAQLNDINIKELFHQFENFGQTYISSSNLEGKTTTNIEFASVWDKKLNVFEDRIYASANLKIEKGELNNYKPILAMSRFIEVEELENIKFNTLTTTIEIKDETVNIPKTDIKSSALDLTISGTHSFRNEIDYRFKLLMSEILSRKAKKNKKENSEFGYIEDDGLGKTTLFLHMKGTVDDYKIGYDTKGLKESWKEDIQEEKRTLKTILNKEFGWFKKDTTLKKENTKDAGLQIEWEEDEMKENENKTKEKDKRKKKKKKGFGKLIDDIAKPDEDEFIESDEF